VVATARVHAQVRIGKRIAKLAARAICIFVTRTDARVAKTARALTAQRARLPEFAQTRRVAAVAIEVIAIVARFGRFDDAIATSRIDTEVRIGEHVAKLASRAICILITRAGVIGRIAEAARALRSHQAGLPDFAQTRRVAPVAVRRISIVAGFRRFEDEVAATRIDTGIGIGNDVAQLAHGAIGIFIAGAREVRRIAQAACAIRRERARLEQLLQAHGVAAVAVRRIAVFASFGRFEDVIAATRIDADIRIGHRIAEFSSGAIDALVASTSVIRGITESAGALTRNRTRLAEFAETNVIASVAARRIAVVTCFGNFEDAIAASRIDADVWIRRGVAKLNARAIREFVASTDVARGIAERARTNVVIARARLPELPQAYRIAAIAIVLIAIIAAFARVDDAIAATGRDA